MFQGNKMYKNIYVAQSHDGTMNFIFMVKAPERDDASRKDLEQMILITLKALELEKFV